MIKQITGSSGLIGSALARRREAQYEVICFDREGAPHPAAECDCVNCDLTSDKSVQEALWFFTLSQRKWRRRFFIRR